MNPGFITVSSIERLSDAIKKSGKDWRIFCPEKLESTFSEFNTVFHNELDLTKTLRSHIAEDVALWVEKLIEGNISSANELSPP